MFIFEDYKQAAARKKDRAMNLKVRLTVMNFLEYAVWGAYLTSMGSYLVKIGMAENIGWFYSVQ